MLQRIEATGRRLTEGASLRLGQRTRPADISETVRRISINCGRGDMRKRRFAVLFGMLVAAAVTLTAVSSSAAAGRAEGGDNRTLAAPAQQLRLPGRCHQADEGIGTKALNGIRKAAGLGEMALSVSAALVASTTGTNHRHEHAGMPRSPVRPRCVSELSSNSTCQPDLQPSTCRLNLTSPRTNLAIALQVITQRNGGSSGSQGGTQTREHNTAEHHEGKPVVRGADPQASRSARGPATTPTTKCRTKQGPRLPGRASGHAAKLRFRSSLKSRTPSRRRKATTRLQQQRCSGDSTTQLQQSQQTANVCQAPPSDCPQSRDDVLRATSRVSTSR